MMLSDNKKGPLVFAKSSQKTSMKTNPDFHRILQKPNALSFVYKLNLTPLTSPNDYFLSYKTPLL